MDTGRVKALAKNIQGDISKWDTSRVKHESMFRTLAAFNQALGLGQAQVTDMDLCFICFCVQPRHRELEHAKVTDHVRNV